MSCRESWERVLTPATLPQLPTVTSLLSVCLRGRKEELADAPQEITPLPWIQRGTKWGHVHMSKAVIIWPRRFMATTATSLLSLNTDSPWDKRLKLENIEMLCHKYFRYTYNVFYQTAFHSAVGLKTVFLYILSIEMQSTLFDITD